MMPSGARRFGLTHVRAVVAGLALFAIAPTARAGFSDLGGYFGFHLGDTGVGPGIPADVPQSAGQVTSPDGNSVKLFGSFGPIHGADWDINFVFLWQGSYTTPINPGDNFAADLDFSTNVTGGLLKWHYFADMFSIDGFEHSRIDTPFTALANSDHVSGVHLESNPFTEPSPSGAQYMAYLQLDWTGFSPTDTLSLDVPPNSIDASFVPVPEPMSATLAVSACAAILLRRRGAMKKAHTPK